MMKLIALILFFGVVYGQDTTLNVYVDRPGHRVSPLLWGIFYEEINHSGDGGLYAELVKNRVMTPKQPTASGYSVIKSGAANGRIYLSREHGLNDVLTSSLRLNIETAVGANERLGIANEGYFGIPIRPDYTQYRASFYAKATVNTSLVVSIESRDGAVVYANATVTGVTGEFQRFEVLLTPPANLIANPRSDNFFVISTNGPMVAGTSIFFQVVSLFPPTFNNRPNGLRVDLAQKLVDAKPTFFRFPGGNFLEGDSMENRFNWEETIGDISRRPGHLGPWNYYSTDGFGLLEMLELAEDLNAEIILGVFAGYVLNGDSIPPEEMGPYIESALNEIEYIIGGVNTVWGARRAADGHPTPFNLTYIEIGNEDWISRDYEIRYALFYDAILEKYPQMEIIATTYVNSRPVPIRDDHFYPGFGWFPDNHDMYDSADRNGSKIFVGEYAMRDNYNSTPEAKASTSAAMDDAAFMTGIERNSDIVVMACYAPLFGHLNDLSWSPDGIYYNGLISFATPAWWVQHLFSVHQGDTYIPTDSNAIREKFFYVASRDTAANRLIIKMVNTWYFDIMIDNVVLHGVSSTNGGNMYQLTGGQWDVNDLSDPMRVSPTLDAFNVTSDSFSFNSPAFSLTIFEIDL